ICLISKFYLCINDFKEFVMKTFPEDPAKLKVSTDAEL
ncbi:hypothetical protein X975_13882, partial [Stegodyphus mimosarum]